MMALPVTQPFPWEQLLTYLSSRCIPQFETIENHCFHRLHDGKKITISYNSNKKLLEVQSDTDTKDKTDICQRVERIFYPSLPTSAIYRQLATTLPVSRKAKGFRPIGCWDPFELCVRTIIGQQVSVAAAQTLIQRLVDRCDILTPQAVVGANLENMGMPGRRVQTLRNLGQAAIDREIDFNWPWIQLDHALAHIAGIGPWTRGYLAIRLGRDADAFPETDVGLIRAADAGSAKELLDKAEAWRPYRAYAATCLWSFD